MQAVSEALEACQGIQDRDRQAAQSGDGSGRHAAEEVTRIANSFPFGYVVDASDPGLRYNSRHKKLSRQPSKPVLSPD